MELKGILEIEVRSRLCKVDYNLMIPNGFPKKSPYVRIINRNTDYTVDSFYQDVRSPTDPKSFILNEKLNEIKHWDSTKSIVNVIIESQDLMRNHFPFTKPTSKNNNSGFNNNNNKVRISNIFSGVAVDSGTISRIISRTISRILIGM